MYRLQIAINLSQAEHQCRSHLSDSRDSQTTANRRILLGLLSELAATAPRMKTCIAFTVLVGLMFVQGAIGKA